MSRNFDKVGDCRVCGTPVTCVEVWTRNGEGTNFGWSHAEEGHDDHRAEVEPSTEAYKDPEDAKKVNR